MTFRIFGLLVRKWARKGPGPGDTSSIIRPATNLTKNSTLQKDLASNIKLD